MLLESGNVLIEAEESGDENLHLGTKEKPHNQQGNSVTKGGTIKPLKAAMHAYALL